MCKEVNRPYDSTTTKPLSMTPGQEAHLSDIKQSFVTAIDKKYREGQAEHGGNLYDVDAYNLVKNALDEAVDLFVYLRTTLDKLAPVAPPVDRDVQSVVVTPPTPGAQSYQMPPIMTPGVSSGVPHCGNVSPNGRFRCQLPYNHIGTEHSADGGRATWHRDPRLPPQVVGECECVIPNRGQMIAGRRAVRVGTDLLLARVDCEFCGGTGIRQY